MSTIVTRTAKGAPLTNAEIDANFTNLNTDKLEKAGGAVTGALSVAGIFTANGAVSANAGLTATKSYSVTSAGSVPALVTWGSFGGGLALKDGAAYAGLYTSALGADLHVYTGVTASDTAVSKVRLSISGASGNTGFGTTAPTAALHAYRSTAVEVSAMAQNSAGYAKYGVDTSGVGQLVAGSWNVYANTTTLAVAVDSSGNVGIGTNAPSDKLDVVGRVTNGGGGGDGRYFARNGSGTIVMGLGVGTLTGAPDSVGLNVATSTGTLDLGTNNTTRLRVDSAGNVNIPTSGARITADFSNAALASRVLFQTSTANGATALGVIPNGAGAGANFNAFASSDPTNSSYGQLLAVAGADVRISSQATGSGAYLPMTFYTSGAERLRVDTSGRVAINRNSASFSPGTARTAIDYPGNTDWALGLRDTSAQSTVWPIVFLNSSEGIAGSVSMTATSTSYNTSSDERLKENIEDAADPGAVIDAIQIRQFDWIATGEHQDFGVVAQELEQVYPPAVPEATVGPDGEEMYRGVDYSKLVPLLVKEVQLLRARVAQLEGGSQ